MEKQEKRRLYEIIAYSEYFTELMYNVMQLKGLRWYWVYHDKDLKDDGSIKDPHYHILIYFDNAKTLSSLMKNIKFDKQEKIKFFKKGSDDGRLDYRVRYLIHYKSFDAKKHEYSLTDIHTNDATIDRFFLDNENQELNDITMIFDYFDNKEDVSLSYRNFLNYILSNNLWSTYRRNAYVLNRLFDEHNADLKDEVLRIFR